jgi:hypothetical protein
VDQRCDAADVKVLLQLKNPPGSAVWAPLLNAPIGREFLYLKEKGGNTD